MAIVDALFRAQPGLGWLLVACLLLAAELADAKMRFAWGALAALAPALLTALKVPLDREAEIAIFAALFALAAALFARERRMLRAKSPRPAPWHGLPTPAAGAPEPGVLEELARRRARATGGQLPSLQRSLAKPHPTKTLTTPTGDPRRARGLVGQTARSLTEFSNGLGRVWLAGAEWGAELVSGDALAPDSSVEVVGVSGGVRLQVRAV